MKTRIIVSVILLPIFFAVLFVFPPYILTAVVSLICAIAAYELLSATFRAGKRVKIYTLTSAALLPVAVYINADPAIAISHLQATDHYLIRIILFLLLSLLFVEAILAYKTEKQIFFPQILIALFGGVVIPFLLSSLISLKTMPEGHLMVLLPIVCAFLTDSGAYFTGVAIGKRKVCPNVSPKKTLEGCLGGIISGIAGMLLYGMILDITTQLTVYYYVLGIYGIIGSVVTELGDLAFSLIKREYDIKDYGKLIPGHGGMLDRFDSMIFTAPTMYLLLTAIPAVQA
jgi:phosphatidate cytidylyltransferase